MNSLERALREIMDWENGTGERVMKHTVTVNGVKHIIEAMSQKEFKEKLRKLEEYKDDDGA